MRLTPFIVLIALSACRDTESSERIAALEAELIELRADVETMQATPIAPDIERLSTGVDSNTAALSTLDADQQALAEALEALTERVAAIEGALGTTGSDLVAFVDRLNALESEDISINTRIDATEALIAAIDTRVVTVEGDYVVSGNLDGVLTEAMLGDDFADLQALLDTVTETEDGLADAASRLEAVETDGVVQADLDALADTMTELADRIDGIEVDFLTSVDLDALDGRLTDIENDYWPQAAGETLSLRISDIESDYTTQDALTDVDTRVSDIESDYVRGAELSDVDLRISDIESDYVRGTELSDVDQRISDIEVDYVRQDEAIGLDARLSDIESDYLTSFSLDDLEQRVSGVESDYVSRPELESVQDELNNISSDYITSGDLSILQGQVDDIASDYVTSIDVDTLDQRISDVETDYLTSVDRSDIDQELSSLTDLLIDMESAYQTADDDLLTLIADNEEDLAAIGGAERQEVFRVESSGNTWTNATSWRAHNTAATGTVVVPGRPFNWALVLGGHYVDDSGKTMRFRMRYVNNQTGAVQYIPSSGGFRKYVYVDHSRLEEQTMVGVAELPEGTYTARLEFYQESGSGRYSWSSSYGQIVHTVW